MSFDLFKMKSLTFERFHGQQIISTQSNCSQTLNKCRAGTKLDQPHGLAHCLKTLRQRLPENFQICPDLDTATMAFGPFHRLCLDQKSKKSTRKIKKCRNVLRKARTENLAPQPPIRRAEQPNVQRAMHLPVRSTEGPDAISRLAFVESIRDNETMTSPVPYREQNSSSLERWILRDIASRDR
jgi:hypothetical protein